MYPMDGNLQLNSLRVVVADDSAMVRKCLVEMLLELEHVQVVGEAEDVGRTLESVRALRPEVVVLDIQMPGGNGITALKHIKRDFPEICVIMLTNHSNPFYRDTCLRAGADFFLDKSIEFEKVGEALMQLVQTGRV